MRLRFKPTHVVLAMLCVMYLITYVDRVNISTAASEIQKELGLSNTQLGLVFSAFAYPYLLFQAIGGWIGDRLGPRKTLFWCGMIWAAATIMTGFVSSLSTLFMARVALGSARGQPSQPRHARCSAGYPPTKEVLRKGSRMRSPGWEMPSRRL
jgi:MFS family permease